VPSDGLLLSIGDETGQTTIITKESSHSVAKTKKDKDK
jgi:hypothetical protein